MNNFNIGDRVECVAEGAQGNDALHIGLMGTVVALDGESWHPIGVEWDDDINGHTVAGCAECGHGYWMNERDIALCNFENFEPETESVLERLLFG